jgi:hypothetical protein
LCAVRLSKMTWTDLAAMACLLECDLAAGENTLQNEGTGMPQIPPRALGS